MEDGAIGVLGAVAPNVPHQILTILARKKESEHAPVRHPQMEALTVKDQLMNLLNVHAHLVRPNTNDCSFGIVCLFLIVCLFMIVHLFVTVKLFVIICLFVIVFLFVIFCL